MTKIWFITLLLLWGNVSFGQQLNKLQSDSVMNLIESRLRSTKSQQLNFTVTKQIKGLANPVVQNGNILFKNPDKLRYNQLGDHPWQMVVDGDEVYTRDGDEKVEKRGKAMSKLKDFIISGINGDALKDKEFERQFLVEDGKLVAVLTPLQGRMKKYVSEIKIEFTDAKDVSDFVVVQPNGNSTHYRFTDLKRNIEIADSQFSLK